MKFINLRNRAKIFELARDSHIIANHLNDWKRGGIEWSCMLNQIATYLLNQIFDDNHKYKLNMSIEYLLSSEWRCIFKSNNNEAERIEKIIELHLIYMNVVERIVTMFENIKQPIIIK